MDLYQQFIAISRYARWLPDQQRRETWPETVGRYCNFWFNRGLVDLQTMDKLEKAIIDLEIMPSMRCLMTAGEALDRDEMAGYNCSYIAMDGAGEEITIEHTKLDDPLTVKVKDPVCFDELMYVLMCGTGVGFSVERQFVQNLPVVGKKLNRRRYSANSKNYPRVPKEEISVLDKANNIIRVHDSKYGWASALRILIFELYNGNFKIKWDTSSVRPAGAKLKTFGGRASGPEPLNDLFNFTKELFENNLGHKLSSIDVHDLCCKIADIVVVGGTRRSALISLSNPSDTKMRKAKSGQWWIDNSQRALANNSACYTDKPAFEEFLDEWLALYTSKSGERGFFSREASKNQAAKNGRRDTSWDYGTNPCCFSGDMRLLTSEGYKTFYELNGKQVELINHNGEITKGEVWSSGIKPVSEVRFNGDKSSILCTPDHVFMTIDGKEVEAQNLRGKRIMPYYKHNPVVNHDSLLAGFIQGDGNCTRLLSSRHKGIEVNFCEKDHEVAELFDLPCTKGAYSTKAREIALSYGLRPAILPERGWPIKLREEFITNFLMGVYSANGCVISSAKRVSLKSTCREFIDSVQGQLEKLGISSYVTVNKSKLNQFSNGYYVCRESYDLNITRHESLKRFAEEISFIQQYKRDALDSIIVESSPKVKSVKPIGEMEVFDFTEPKTNWGVVEGCVVHNSEIILRSLQTCNLSEVVVREDDTLETLTRKVELATILGTLQSTLTNFAYVRPKWKQNCEDERLLGVSLTGIMDNKLTSGYEGEGKLIDTLTKLKQVAIDTNKEWSNKLGVNVSAAITCVNI